MFHYTPNYAGYQLSVVQRRSTECVCVCHRVRSSATAILYTYNDQVETGHRKKERVFNYGVYLYHV
jgi:hypothetical protein